MSALRKYLRLPQTYLGVFFCLIALTVGDTLRTPESQVTARLYVSGVHLYQFVGRPLLEGHIQCRYNPTCSDYSIEAVRKFGIIQGIAMTRRRIESCQNSVPLGTYDPVPAAAN
jgi:putative membrane protein insertion efficiency factor